MATNAIDVASLRIRIPPVRYDTPEFDELTPTPLPPLVQFVNYSEDNDDDPYNTCIRRRFRVPTPHPSPPKQRSFAFYLATGRINEILPSPPKFSVGHTMDSLVPSHMSLLEYWQSQVDLTELTEDDLMPPVDWIPTA
jgi:hypothetical protein